MRNSTFKLEKKLLADGYDFIIGVDEAGRGPLALAPVVASAAVLKSYDILFGHPMSKIRDSKKLSEKQREKLYDFICEHFYVGVGICDHKTIDRVNILEATFLSMKKALSDLERNLKRFSRYSEASVAAKPLKAIVLVDGNKIIPNLSMEQRAIIRGDNLVKSISAASIIAKVTRDRMMREMHKKYPGYNFHQHKGYGTKLHLEMIRKHGPCEIHRKSFEPIKSWTYLG